MKNLKEKTIRGGIARLSAQAANFALRLGSLMILARLLGPKDFGLVGMVTAFTGILTLFRDFGLSAAAVQRIDVTDEQISTLFWINILVGAILAVLTAAAAPAIAAFYHEPRLLAVTAVLALGFVFNAAGIQHSVLLQRQMRFTALAVIGVVSLILSTAIGIGGAKAGYGYWSLVAMTVSLPLTATILFWIITGWLPGIPRKQTGIRSMLRFGGTLTLNGLVAYLAYNSEKILIGRFWGAGAIGIYGRAYQLINIPTDNLNSAVGEVAFSALSRVQDDPGRFKSYFLKGYSLVVGMTLPITMACALFADDLILVVLGPKWKDAIPIFRLLAPTIVIFAVINPLGWLLTSLGMVTRGLRIALVFAPVMIAGYVMGLPYGPKGVAFAYSGVMALWAIPLIAWCVRGTVITLRDILLAVTGPLASAIVAGCVSFGARLAIGQLLSPLTRLVLECILLLATYAGMLLFVPGQRSLYWNLFRGLKKSSPVEEGSLVS
ncbi:PST family polysaccharide transporter [Silvibacterium bohemicum]|uniref:PST family polysaccharide transporter n=1 Tax=Silvibacterium bohemicum TaxID=1577686 RepID=A0A841JQM9_9BACT|nr:lipopolysaccharide biosynthesis protein [Silvibacterium bohemicum]MBB6142857.1 PST family polysaccharide transporter [Silvibacterium bohemicum]